MAEKLCKVLLEVDRRAIFTLVTAAVQNVMNCDFVTAHKITKSTEANGTHLLCIAPENVAKRWRAALRGRATAEVSLRKLHQFDYRHHGPDKKNRSRTR